MDMTMAPTTQLFDVLQCDDVNVICDLINSCVGAYYLENTIKTI